MRLTTADRDAARRELARRYTADFAASVDIPTVPTDDQDVSPTLRLQSMAAHHKLLCDKLDDLEAGRIPNLMVFMPPGAAKSTYVDVVFIPRFMAKKPRRHVILASYASAIAAKQGRRARQLIKQPAFEQIFGCTLDPDKTAADEWMLTNGSEYMAGGILSGLTGNRAALGVLDDPIRGREAAESETIRDKTWEAYQDDFCSRLIPGAPQIMILTRWHELDPAGRILPEGWDGESGLFDGRDGRQWYVICLPAIADRLDDPLGREIGETLWPEWFSHEHWKPFQTNPRTWTSLYQQKPTAAEGTFFQEAWFKRYSERPKALNVYMTSDHAPGGKQDSDFNVFRVWGIDNNQHIWLLDGYRVQGTIDKAMGVELDDVTGEQRLGTEGALPLIKKWRPLAWFPEADNNWKSAEPFVCAAMRRNKIACRIEPLSTAGGDKPTKALAFQAKAIMGEVHIPIGLMGQEVLEQYKKFPTGKNDDEIDAAANMGRALEMAHPAILKTVSVVNEPRDRWHRPKRDAGVGSVWG